MQFAIPARIMTLDSHRKYVLLSEGRTGKIILEHELSGHKLLRRPLAKQPTEAHVRKGFYQNFPVFKVDKA